MGIYRAAVALEKKAHIVINDVSTSIKPLYDEIAQSSVYGKDIFLTSGEALDYISDSAMVVAHEQKEIFNFHFARVFGRASAIHGNQMKSAVTRIAINIFRIISIIALLRSLESLLPGGERSGESNFGTDAKYGNFFSVSGGWNIHQEEFFKAKDWVQQLKLR